MNNRNLTKLAVLSAVIYLGFPQIAYCYIDPGSGSQFLQFLIAGLLGAIFSLKIFWSRLRSYPFRKVVSAKISKIFKGRP